MKKLLFGLAILTLLPVLAWAATDDLGNAPAPLPNHQMPGQPSAQQGQVLTPITPGLAPVIVVPNTNQGAQGVPNAPVPGVLVPETVVPGVTTPVPDGSVVVPQLKETLNAPDAQNGLQFKEPVVVPTPVTPVVPGTTPVQPVPVQPVPVTPVPVQPVPVTPVVPATQTPPTMMSPADFLLKAEDLEKPANKVEIKPDSKSNVTPDVKSPEAANAPKAKSQKEKSQKDKPEVKETPKVEPALKPEGPPAKGDQLMIPEGAKETGDVSFLEGCWKGERPEYSTKRMITERFCFDDKGVGKRTITDPEYAGTCVGATKAVLNSGGVLQMVSEQSFCSEGNLWGSADMTCKGEGNSTPCSWKFKDAGSKAKQSYSIRFVRD